jgi:iron complex outermembrane receptor protein
VQHSAARYAMSMTAMHTLKSGVAVSLMHGQSEDIALMSEQDPRLYTLSRTDVRLAKALRLGVHKAEVALVVQNLDQPVRDGDKKFFFDRRAFISFQLEL